MNGNVHGHIDCLTIVPAATSGAIQEMFTNIFQHYMNMCSSSYAQLISLYTGSAATGTPPNSGGTNYYNQPNPFGENAWACFKILSGTAPDGSVSARAWDYYVLFSWCSSNSPSAGKGSPMLFNSSTGNGIAASVAWRDDGLSPWNGTTYSTQSVVSAGYGNDNLGSAIWTAGTSSLRVFPRSNNTGGTHVTNKNNLTSIYNNGSLGSNQTIRHHIISDRDSTYFTYDSNDNSNYDGLGMWGIYDPIANLTTGVNGLVPMPMFAFCNATQPYISLGTVHGDTAGSSAANGGVAAQPARMTAGARGVRNERFVNLVFVGSSIMGPSLQYVTSTYDLFRIPVIMYESPDFGFLGYVNFVSETFNCNVNETNAGQNLAVFGQTPSSNTPQMIVPWSGSSPGTIMNRTGFIF